MSLACCKILLCTFALMSKFSPQSAEGARDCKSELGMQSKGIPDESISASSTLSTNHVPAFARLDEFQGAWCSAPNDNSPYIQILLDEEKLITKVTTQGSYKDIIWATKYQIKYLKEGNWFAYQRADRSLTLEGNTNVRALKENDLQPSIRTSSIRIYPIKPQSVMQNDHNVTCLRLELYGCSVIQCGDPGKPANGEQKVIKGFVHGGSVMFTCDKDYTLRGSSTIHCQENKTWTASIPQCLAPCPDPGYPHQGNRIGNDFRHDKTVTFACPRNYVMAGARTIKCSNGRWSNTKPSCKGSCPQPRTPFRGTLHGYKARFIEGDEVRFSCNTGYDLLGNAKLRCVGRNWNSREPDCKARCRFSGRPAHGFYIKGSWNRGDMIKHGEKITYGCLASYAMVGANMQECDNGRWTNDIPMCKASCRPLADIANGRKIDPGFSHGRTVRFECDAEYALEGNTRLACNDGTWDSDPPKCRAPCGNPGAPLNGNIQGGDFRHNSWVTFVCDQNYQLDGKKRIHCNDGSWSGSVPDCIAVCPDPGVPTNGQRLHDNFQDGTTVTFRCNRNYDLVGNETIRCDGGVWSSDAPECKGRCTFDGNPDNGYTPTQLFRRGESLPHGSNVEYVCDVSYTMVGSNVRHCDDGSWNTSVPSCKVCGRPVVMNHGHFTRRMKVTAKSYPWMVSMWNTRENKHFCGGSLVSKRWVVTAAQCLSYGVSLGDFEVRLGKLLTNKQEKGREQIIGADRFVIHPQFSKDRNDFDSDVALIHLSSDAVYNDYVKPICLPLGKNDADEILLRPGNIGVITGWGRNEESGITRDRMYHLSAPIVSQTKCKFPHPRYIVTSNMFCAGFANGTVTTCNGDAGGPLAIKNSPTGSVDDQRWVLVGIVSWGDGCGRIEKYDVFTRVTVFAQWINDQINPDD